VLISGSARHSRPCWSPASPRARCARLHPGSVAEVIGDAGCQP